MKKPTNTPTDAPRAIEASGSFAGIDMPFKQAAATPASGSAVSTQASPTPRRHVTRPKP